MCGNFVEEYAGLRGRERRVAHFVGEQKKGWTGKIGRHEYVNVKGYVFLWGWGNLLYMPGSYLSHLRDGVSSLSCFRP